MTGLRRTLGLVVALAAFDLPARALILSNPGSSNAGPIRTLDEAQDAFNRGIDLLERGRRDEALKVFQQLLATGMTQEQAYDLWKSAGDRPFTLLLVEGGEFELAAKRIFELSRAGRNARKNDAAAIQALVGEVTSTAGDPIARRKALRTLASEHGEYAVPYLLPLLAGSGDDERRVLAMHALTQMDSDVVPPLVEAFESQDPVLRRNVAMVLGNIGDTRAAGHLTWRAAHDPDASVQTAARESMGRIDAGGGRGGQAVGGDALAHFLRTGDAYHHRRDSVLRDQDYSEVVWTWADERLVGNEVPRFLYGDEMALKAYEQALRADPRSIEALAGLARASISEQTKVEQLERAGTDVAAWKPRAQQALTAVHAAGVEALDLALRWSVDGNDSSTAAALARVLAPICPASCDGLKMALESADGAVRSEAAVALGQIALRTGQAPSPPVVDLLAEAAGREVVRLAAVIDPDEARARGLVSALEQQGIYASHWSSGARGLSMVRRAPGLDIVLIAENLTDVPTSQLIDELRADDRTAAVPVILITKSVEEAAATWGDKIAGTVTNAGDVESVQAALSKELGGDRALAEDLARRAAEVLARLGQSGRVDLSAAAAKLSAAVGSRPDAVAIPLMRAIGHGGGAEQVTALTEILGDEKRSDEVRIAAADAVALILGRHPNAGGQEGALRIQAAISSQASPGVREAAARALAVVELDPAARVEMIRKLRAGGGQTPSEDEKPK